MDNQHPAGKAIGKRERNRIRNRHAILSAARECFRQQGYDNTTIRDIVRSTGLAAGTFYNYFSSKQDIFSALLSDFLVTLSDNLKDLRQQADSAEYFIHNTYLALFRSTAGDPLVYELAHRNEHAVNQLFGSDLLGLAIESLEGDLKTAVDNGLLPNVDQEYLAAAFFGVGYEMSLRLAYWAYKHPESGSEEAEKAATFATDLFLGGLYRMEHFRNRQPSPNMEA